MNQNLTGRTFGPCELLEIIGTGGMATIYRAHHLRLGHEVAVKVMAAHLAPDASFGERFRREAQTIARLSQHPQIVTVHDYDVQDGLPYVVMQLLTGGTLSHRLAAQEPLSLDEAGRILVQIALALDHAHDSGVIHRDLKPSNVLFDEWNNAYLADFGIAKLMEDDGGLTQPGTGMGTPSYMAPEQWTGKVGHQADLYALGIIAYAMLIGRPPFEGTPHELMRKHLDEKPTPITTHRPDLPEALDKMMARALAKRPGKRYQSAWDLAEAFEAAVYPLTGQRQLVQHTRHMLPKSRPPASSSRIPETPKSSTPSTMQRIKTITQEALQQPRQMAMAGGSLLLVGVAVVLLVLLATPEDTTQEGAAGAKPTTPKIILMPTDTPTRTPRPTETPLPTATLPSTPTPTCSKTPTPTRTATFTSTPRPTQTPQPTYTSLRTATPISTPTADLHTYVDVNPTTLAEIDVDEDEPLSFARIGNETAGAILHNPVALTLESLTPAREKMLARLGAEGSLIHKSLAVGEGWTLADVLEAEKANTAQCERGETPLACELRVVGPDAAFILADSSDRERFRGDLVRVLARLEAAQVVPVLVTFPGQEQNAVFQDMADREGIPLLDLAHALGGLGEEAFAGEAPHLSNVGARLLDEAALDMLKTLFN